MTAKTTTRYALTLLAGAGTLAALAACSSTATAGDDSADTTTTAPTSATSPTPTATGAAGDAAGTGSYTDGSYEAEGAYTSPGGNEKVGVSLTLADGVITEVTVTPESENPTGQQYQERFASGISGEVVGKSLDEIDVSKVSGSSLTATGFNEAVETIKADATA